MSYRISCIISTYCDAGYVCKKIEEIERQTIFDEVEFIFIETGSPERERDEIFPYTEKYSNIRLLATDDRRSLYEAWNMGWVEAADLIISSMERTIGAKKVTYDFERMMDGADLVSCSGFADEMIKRM